MLKIKEISEFSFCEDTERSRIINTFGFNLEIQKMLLAMLDAFVMGDMENVLDIWNKMPESEIDECNSREYVSLVIGECVMNYAAFGKTYEITPEKKD